MQSNRVNPATCVTCRLRHEWCICADAPRRRITTRLIVIIHSKEWRRTTNTGHLARLAVQDVELRVHGSPKQRMSDDGIETSASTLILYPGRGATPLSADLIAGLPRPLTLLVPDGNWNQSQHMMRRLPVLRAARPVCIDGPRLDFPCSRRNRIGTRMSTFEAIARALGILEGQPTQDALLAFFHQALGRMIGNSRRAHLLTERAEDA